MNVDDESIYLTTSGNWAEAKKLKEKSSASAKANRKRINRISLFIFLVAAMVVVALLYALSNESANKLVFVVLPIVGFKVYGYFKPDLGKRYQIPVAKIQSFEPVPEGFEIQFTNLDGELDSETITGIQGDGIRILNGIRLNIFPLNESPGPSQKGIE